MDEKSDTSGAAPRPSSPSLSHPMPASQVELALVDLEHNAPLKFPSNEIKTSKYNLITFLPLTLMEQFRRVSNVYFALVAAIGFIPGASPFTPLSNAMPLVFVIAVAMVKAAYEDIQRHRSDYKANSVHATVFRDGAWIEVPSFKVQVGDLLLIRNGEEVRADCCLLYSSDHEGIGYIDTASLDGESSLKTKRCRPFTQHFFHHADLAQRLQAAEDTRFMMIVDTPCANLESWKGIIEQRDAATNEVLCSSPATIHQFLPRGSNVRNVDLVIGGVVYTGVDTKLFLNLKHSLSKMSHLDRVVNKFIAGVFVVNQLLIIGLCAGAVVWTNSVANSGLWYAQPYLSKFTNGGGAYVFFWQYLGFFALMSFMIPISLFVSLELVKVTQALFMAWDPRMTYVDAKTGETKYCRPKTSDLNDQLAQVKYIFTDKTGTLTENKMNFLQLVSGNRMHNETVQPGALRQMLEGDTDRDFFTNRLHGLAFAMSTCHSVLAFTKESEEGGRLYDGTSPDEVALVRTASRNGYVLTSRNSQQVVVDILGTPMTVDVLAELEFSAERKRMSVLVQLPDKRIVLLTKGADSAILPLSDMTDPASQQMRENVEQELETMSLQGLRTLVFGFRFIEKEKAEKWLTVFEEASRSMGQRVAALHDAYDQIEFGFMLFGATGVEDKLQDGVEDTIRFFIDAGVTIWMLTGDKRETAVTIASTSGLWRPDNIAHHLDVTQEYDPHSDPDEMWKFLGPDIERTHASLLADPGTQFLVIDGLTLSIFLRYDPDRFAAMGALCMGAVCCRLTPMQKADCVRLFQTRSGKTVLAVGDGANDVSMIQQARVGIGIMGLEGSQAELSSDYAIPRFKHLRHLLALHGRFSWYRNTTKILYCFYKSIQLSLVLFVFTFWSGYSVQTFFDSWMISLYNTFFTIWFPLSIGMFDKDVEDEVALHRPQLYAIVRDEQMHFNSRSFLNWGIEMALHGAMTYGLGYLYATQDDFDTHSASITHVSTAAFIQLLAAVCATAMLTIQRWDAIQVGAATATILSIPGFIFAYSALDILESTTEVAGIATEVFATPIVYFGTVIILLVFLLGTVARKYISKTEIPTATDAIVAEWHRAKARLARGPRSDRRR